MIVLSTDSRGHGGIARTIDTLVPALARAGALSAHLVVHRDGDRVIQGLKASVQLPGLLARYPRATVWAHAGGPVSVARMLGLLGVAKANGARTVLQLHSVHVSGWKRRVRAAAMLVDEIVVSTESWRASLANAGVQARVVPIPLPRSAEAALDRQRPQRPDRPFTIGTLARLVPGKGVRRLAAAVQATPGVRLVIGGEGPLDLPDDPRIERLGWVSEPTAFFDRVDLYASAGTLDTWNLGLAEAMAHGVPVLAHEQGPAWFSAGTRCNDQTLKATLATLRDAAVYDDPAGRDAVRPFTVDRVVAQLLG